jgi:hypothetical protein
MILHEWLVINFACFADPDYVVSGHRDFQKSVAESFKTQTKCVSQLHLFY